MGDTTWYRERQGSTCEPWPILWRAWVAPGRRNARKGVGQSIGLRYVLISWETRPSNPETRLVKGWRGGKSVGATRRGLNVGFVVCKQSP